MLLSDPAADDEQNLLDLIDHEDGSGP